MTTFKEASTLIADAIHIGLERVDGLFRPATKKLIGPVSEEGKQAAQENFYFLQDQFNKHTSVGGFFFKDSIKLIKKVIGKITRMTGFNPDCTDAFLKGKKDVFSKGLHLAIVGAAAYICFFSVAGITGLFMSPALSILWFLATILALEVAAVVVQESLKQIIAMLHLSIKEMIKEIQESPSESTPGPFAPAPQHTQQPANTGAGNSNPGAFSGASGEASATVPGHGTATSKPAEEEVGEDVEPGEAATTHQPGDAAETLPPGDAARNPQPFGAAATPQPGEAVGPQADGAAADLQPGGAAKASSTHDSSKGWTSYLPKFVKRRW